MSDNITISHTVDGPRGSITSEDLRINVDENNCNDPSEVSFDLKVVLEGFKKCKGSDEQLYLDDYIRGYVELNKFFQLLGNVFNFVASDVQKKITILQCYRKGGAGDYYYSVQSMIEYEKEHGILTSNAQQSGSRTLLRLHRALEFIAGFLEELRKAANEAKLGSVSSDVYSRTLAKHHGWVIAKTVSAILYLMPTKQTIIDKVTKGDETIRVENEAILPQTIDSMTSIYNLTQKLYEDYDILDLP